MRNWVCSHDGQRGRVSNPPLRFELAAQSRRIGTIPIHPEGEPWHRSWYTGSTEPSSATWPPRMTAGRWPPSAWTTSTRTSSPTWTWTGEWEDIKATLLPGVTYQEWIDAYLALRPTLHLIESRSGDVKSLHTSSAEQFSGLAVASGPAFVWTELDGDTWSIKLHRDGETKTLESGTTVLQDPSVTRDDKGVLWTAWVSREDDGDVVYIVDETGGSRSFQSARSSPEPGSGAGRGRGVLRTVPGRPVACLLLEGVRGVAERACAPVASQPVELPASLCV